jgi:hypothetical protein
MHEQDLLPDEPGTKMEPQPPSAHIGSQLPRDRPIGLSTELLSLVGKFIGLLLGTVIAAPMSMCRSFCVGVWKGWHGAFDRFGL